MTAFARFDTKKDRDFLKTIRKRVNEHFKSNDISRFANSTMVVKTIVMFALYLIPFLCIISGLFTNYWVIFLFWMIMGIGKSGIGLSVMHDANHGAYSRNPRVNRLLGLSMNIIGANAEVWKLQHNVLHHTYTNVDQIDDDINAPSFLRFTPYQELRPIHRFQFLYFWFFYGISILARVTFREYFRAYKFKKMGLTPKPGQFRELMVSLVIWKVIYFGLFLALPIWLSPVPVGFTILCFVIMHFIVGLTLSMVFQSAHVLPNCEIHQSNESGDLENSWIAHELKTTSNFAPNSKVLSWFIGGLNFQIEHHLFPNICHVHYKSISKIVEQTAREFDLPYNSYPSFTRASMEHVKLLYDLGRAEKVR
ncbi:acyl-CoA desaturase [bacterium SCSIO 12741]|nr:acyl-CoA desaturase [bacterium SCSIO 12741]